MVFALLLPQRSVLTELADLIEGRSVIYLPNPDYCLYLITGDIPRELLEQIVPARLGVEYKEAAAEIQHNYSFIEEFFQPERNRELIARRSRLTYLITEYLSPDGFYFQLDGEKNEDLTFRTYRYNLYYEKIPCWTTPEIVGNLAQIEQQMTVGLLITSTYDLSQVPAPSWYVRETLRDLYDMTEFNTTNKVLLAGPRTGELYLFYDEPVNISDDDINELGLSIRGRILANIRLRIFPRNTPPEWVLSRRLVRDESERYTLPYPVPENVPVFAERMKQTIVFPQMSTLYWFYYLLKGQTTWEFIEKELEVTVQPNQIIVTYETRYLPDYLRVLTASQVTPSSDYVVEVIYPELGYRDLSGKTWVKFIEQLTGETIILATSLPPTPKVILSVPDFTLTSRAELDINPSEFSGL